MGVKRVCILVINGAVSAITSFIMCGIGVWFSLYLTQKIGTAVMGEYQLILSAYAFGVTFASSGVQFAAMRLISENIGRSPQVNVRRILRKCFGYCAVFGLGGGILLYSLAPLIGSAVLKNNAVTLPLRVISLSLPFVAAGGVINGYFAAVRKVYKMAAVQVGEQLLKIILTVVTISYFMARGQACLALILAGVISEGLSVFISLLLCRRDCRQYRGREKPQGSLLRIGLPIAFSSYLRSGLVSVRHLLVPSQLQKYGMEQRQAVAAFGMIHGIVLPVVFFPTALLYSFSNLLVPEVAETRTRTGSESRRMTYLIDRSVQLTLLFSIGVAGFFYFFAEELMGVVRGGAGIGIYLKMLALVVPVMYLDHTVDNMLKGLDQQVQSMKYNIVDAAFSLGCIFLFLPRFGTAGYVCLICLSELLNFTLSFRRLTKVSSFHLLPLKGVVFPIACIVLACKTGRYAGGMWGVTGMGFLIAAGCLSLALYFVFLRLTGCFTQNDADWLRRIFQRN